MDLVKCYFELFQDYAYYSANNSIECNSKENIYLNNSNIHGIGLFAKKDIKPNEIITIYPAHIIHITKSLNPLKIHKMRCIIDLKESSNWKDYAIKYDNNVRIYGHPSIKDDENLLGHLCNDGYKHDYKINNKKNRNKYNNKTKELNNCKFSKLQDTPYIAIISTKKINKDEEILVSYGFEYWLKRNN
jgi:hypothetical protein